MHVNVVTFRFNQLSVRKGSTIDRLIRFQCVITLRPNGSVACQLIPGSHVECPSSELPINSLLCTVEARLDVHEIRKRKDSSVIMELAIKPHNVFFQISGIDFTPENG
jgi:hypothetical protein